MLFDDKEKEKAARFRIDRTKSEIPGRYADRPPRPQGAVELPRFHLCLPAGSQETRLAQATDGAQAAATPTGD